MSGNVALIVAGGSGTRMGTTIPKQYLRLGSRPILAHTVAVFQRAGCIHAIVIVTGQGEEERVRREIVEPYGFSKVTDIVAGGAERYESVYAGLQCCEGAEYVFVQDAVRPFVTEEILQRGLKTATQYGGAVCGVPSKDTVKITDDEGVVQQTPRRDAVWIVQTPQIFSYALLREAYDRVFARERETEAFRQRMQRNQKKRFPDRTSITDDAMLVEGLGVDVHMFMGDYRNIKITTPEDLQIAEALLRDIDGDAETLLRDAAGDADTLVQDTAGEAETLSQDAGREDGIAAARDLT